MAFSVKGVATAAEFLEHLRAFRRISGERRRALKLRQNFGAIFRPVGVEKCLGAFSNCHFLALKEPLATGQRHFSGRDFAGSDRVKD